MFKQFKSLSWLYALIISTNIVIAILRPLASIHYPLNSSSLVSSLRFQLHRWKTYSMSGNSMFETRRMVSSASTSLLLCAFGHPYPKHIIGTSHCTRGMAGRSTCRSEGNRDSRTNRMGSKALTFTFPVECTTLRYRRCYWRSFVIGDGTLHMMSHRVTICLNTPHLPASLLAETLFTISIYILFQTLERKWHLQSPNPAEFRC